MNDFTIDTTAISSIGFKLKEIQGNIGFGEPKQNGSSKEEFTSVNYGGNSFYQKAPEITVSMFGKFSSIQAAETALYTLYGMLVQIGERSFTHSNGTYTEAFKGTMHKGANVETTRHGSTIVFDVKLKIQKSND